MAAKSGSLSIVCVQLGPRKLSIIRSSRVLFRGYLSIEVNGRTVGTFKISWVSVVEGCLLSGVPL